MGERSAAVQKRALEIWQARELLFHPRVRRMIPDDFDHVSGAWQKVVNQAEREVPSLP